jgi:hypothetical protein
MVIIPVAVEKLAHSEFAKNLPVPCNMKAPRKEAAA